MACSCADGTANWLSHLEEEEASELLRVLGEPPTVTVDLVEVDDELFALLTS